MTIHPQHDRLLIKRDEAERITKGGIVLPDGSTQEKPLRGRIMAVGPGKRLASPLNPKGWVFDVMPFSVGDYVLFPKYSGDSFKLDGEEFFFVKADDIIAIIDDAPDVTDDDGLEIPISEVQPCLTIS